MMDWRVFEIWGQPWPDYGIMVAVFWSSFAMRHAILNRTPPGVKSSRETFFVMVWLAVMFVMFQLWWSVAAEIVAALTWGTLWWIARRQSR